MNPPWADILAPIDAKVPRMIERLIEWAEINTGSTNIDGIARFAEQPKRELERLGAAVKQIPLANGAVALSAVKRPGAPFRVFLCIHMDTVYPPDHPFQTCTRMEEAALQGPGVADAKGGILVMLAALEAFEQSPLAARLGWEVLLNPDEEIGSQNSLPLLEEAAQRNNVGLLFEPATADGALIDRRKGSGTFTLTVHGRAAHVGRNFDGGRNAIVALAHASVALDELNRRLNGVTVNPGVIEGGSAANVVPDRATLKFNVRTTTNEDEPLLRRHIDQILADLNARDGIRTELSGKLTSPPKIPDAAGRALMDLIGRCGRELNLPIQWRPSGGACDGNKLAAAGLPNVDTLGPCGGNLHSEREFVLLDSLGQRAKLATLALLHLAEKGKEELATDDKADEHR
jgi:glutamate carboxypeptidase